MLAVGAHADENKTSPTSKKPCEGSRGDLAVGIHAGFVVDSGVLVNAARDLLVTLFLWVLYYARPHLRLAHT